MKRRDRKGESEERRARDSAFVIFRSTPYTTRSSPFASRPSLLTLRLSLLCHHFLAFAKSTAGYTLIETLVASAIFLGVLLPASLVLAKLAMSRHNHDVMIATQLAKDEMEKVILGKSYEDETREIVLDKTRWKLIRTAQDRFGLIEIHVTVYRNREAKPWVELKTLRASP